MDVKVGDIIRIDYMQGEPQYTGVIGVVDHIDDNNQIWLKGCGCALIPYVDEWTVMTSIK